MIYVKNSNDDCFFNHAAEEYLMDNFNDEVFMLWANKPSILIGRNQNTLTEINYDYVKNNNIDIVRRLSGGGAVFNDSGNINFTFITYRDRDKHKFKNSFEKFAFPVIEALKSLGVHAEFTGRNDIVIENKKISGNAQYFQKEKLLHHGTLLFDCDMSNLSSALKSKAQKIKCKGIKSVKGRVTNILPHLKEAISLEEFKNFLEQYIIDTYNIKEIVEFNNDDLKKIKEIEEERFRSWNWNYGKSPKYEYKNSVKHACGLIEYNLNVQESMITDVSIYGDYFGKRDIRELEEVLTGLKHNKADLEYGLKDVNLNNYIIGLSKEKFIEDLLET